MTNFYYGRMLYVTVTKEKKRTYTVKMLLLHTWSLRKTVI